MTPAATFLDTLQSAADQASGAETAFHRELAQRIKLLEEERAYAFRRLNLMHLITNSVMGSDDRDLAIAGSLAMVRIELGWDGEDEGHDLVIAQLKPVSEAVLAVLKPPAEEHAEPQPRSSAPDPVAALRQFEQWYAATYQRSFWSLFDQERPELPLVERC
jgi:hypothetical protein